MTLLRNFVLLIATLSAAPAALSMTCAEFDVLLKRTYGFVPSKLSDSQRPVKIAQMDAVWRAVNGDHALAPCLKAALAKSDDGWFLFDGAQLLVGVDPSRESKELLLKGLTRVALDDIDLRTWIGTASALALEGFDTSELGKRWLHYPRAEYFLPEHAAYRVDRGNGAMFLFGSMEERFATPVLAELARSGKGEAREIAVWLLMSQATQEALRELARLDTRGLSRNVVANVDAIRKRPALIEKRDVPKTTRKEFVAAFEALLAGNRAPFDRLVEAVPDGERDLVAVATPDDLDLLRRVRRRYIAANSPHTIDYYNQFSQILMTLVWKPELVEGK